MAIADDVPLKNERLDQVGNVLVVAGPFVLLCWAVWQAWGGLVHWQDLAVMGVMYVLTGLGITVGYHRLFTHRSFRTSPAVRAVFAVLGSAAVEGPVIAWAATHRKHHRYSDQPGDPHSPHVDHAPGFRGALEGFWHAHLGWTVAGGDRANPRRYAKDLLADPVVDFVSRTFGYWVIAGLGVAFGLGVALTGRVTGGLTALLWGGAVRVFLLHQVTFSINSLCHLFGRRRFDTHDESRNLAWLAPFSLGEAWHNNHHAFPTSAAHGLTRREPDISAFVITGLERLGLAWDVVRIAPARQEQKQIAGPTVESGRDGTVPSP